MGKKTNGAFGKKRVPKPSGISKGGRWLAALSAVVVGGAVFLSSGHKPRVLLPTKESAVDNLGEDAAWMRQKGYPHMDVVDAYMNALKDTNCLVVENDFAGAVLAKGKMGSVKKIYLNPTVFVKHCAAGISDDNYFHMEVGGLLAREAWGWRALDTVDAMGGDDGREFKNLFMGVRNSASPDEILGLAAAKNDSVAKLASGYLGSEYFEMKHQCEYFQWGMEVTGMTQEQLMKDVSQNKASVSYNWSTNVDLYYPVELCHMVAGYAQVDPRSYPSSIVPCMFYLQMEQYQYKVTGGREGIAPADYNDAVQSKSSMDDRWRLFNGIFQNMKPFIQEREQSISRCLETNASYTLKR